MLLEQCRPLNGGGCVCSGICHYGTQKALVPFDGSRSAGTTSPEAGQGRVRRFVRTGSPRKLEGARSQNCPPLRLNYLFRSISVLFGVVELYIEAVSISSAARRDCAEI